ncbi:MAG: HD domain-containing protein [Anaerolineales bacterium]|nr:HD domain-containing protein [Anaerolineales bacterium]
MDTSTDTTSATVSDQSAVDRSRWVIIYTSTIAAMGVPISIYALLYHSVDRDGLFLFLLMAIIAELGSVQLFQTSRSWVSMSSVVAIASIVALGPMAGVLTYLASGLTTGIRTTINGYRSADRASLIRRTAFNAGMLVIAAAAAGTVYSVAGGKTVPTFAFSVIPALILAAIVEWVVNAGILVGVISIQTGQKPVEIWKRDIVWQAPVSIIGGIVGGGFLAVAYVMYGVLGLIVMLIPILSTSYAFGIYKKNMQVYVDGLENLNQNLKDAMSALERSNQELVDANQAISRLNAELFQSLAKVFDMRDPYVGGHAAQVSVYAVSIAQELGLSQEKIELVRQAAFLHDIGKLAIPETILHKPGKLTPIEYEFVKKHSDIGADLLASTEGLKHLAPFVRHHHERWDGNGYPLGLKGSNIPLEARILNLCDSVESMASDRPYHRGKSTEEIVQEVLHCSGTQFDPDVANIFVRLIQQKGPDFVVNSARSVKEQYTASLLTNESLTKNMFAWVLEQDLKE